MVEKVKIEDSLVNYMVNIITTTRESKHLRLESAHGGGNFSAGSTGLRPA